MKKTPTLFRLAIVFMFIIFISGAITAQDVQDSQKALALVKKNAAAIGLSDNNIANSRVANTYVDELSGATLVYLQQTYKGIDVDKAIQVLAFKNGVLVSSAGSRINVERSAIALSPDQQKKAATPAVTAEAAIRFAAQHLKLMAPVINVRPAIGQDFSKVTSFGDIGIAKENVTARLVWIPQKTFERVKLSWEVNISPRGTPDSWRVIVDAGSGNIIKKENYTVHDDWSSKDGKKHLRIGMAGGNNLQANDPSNQRLFNNFSSASYRVIPYPAEAPIFPNGSPTLVTNPWKLSPPNSGATPFIWNDDGLKKYTNTRGNNVLAQEDLEADDGNNGRKAVGTVRNNHLYLDFNPDFSKPPTDRTNQNFAITNLFYWNNIMHDLSYQYGFDEKSGNFQQNNIGRGGKGRDLVRADAQDGSGLNNANFFTPPDGESPRMQMYLFVGSPLTEINSPASIAGRIASVEGAMSPNNLLANVGPVTADVVLYNEATDTLHVGCDPASNSSALQGKIALISRGGCNFTVKVLNAQNAGAAAVIVYDNIPGEAPLIMSGNDSSIVTPAVMISYENGMKIKGVLESGTAVNITLSYAPEDGDLDNGIICHEYGHGISNRLTGGPANVVCLQNAEEMGEGWSDYFALMTTTDWKNAGVNDGYKARGMGTYVLNQPTDGPGIRTYPYSVDMSINPHTYANVAVFGEVHYIGEIWASALWDMTWFIIEQDGINKDIFNAKGEGGNTVAYKLVMTGMKLQPCSPGFIDGRDAILKADTLLYNGKYSCQIWKAFARRGMGISASQGSSFITGDEVVDFNQGAIFITKHGNKTTSPGSDLEYTIGLNAKTVCSGTISPNYSVTDSLPGNVTYVSSDGTYDPSNRTVTFSNINMNGGDSLNYHIKVKVDNTPAFPDSVYLNDPANTHTITDKWVVNSGDKLGWTTLFDFYYYSNDDSLKDATSLTTAQEFDIPGTATTFRFWNEIYGDDFKNGGVVEITTDGGKTWQDAGPYMSGFVYNETITGNSILNGRRAFSGLGYIGYTNIDLSSFAGKKVKLRFVYATSDSSFAVPDGGTGWVVNEISLSASASVTNTAKLFNMNNDLKGISTVVTKIEGDTTKNFIAVKRNDAEALLTWQKSGELIGSYKVERSDDKGLTFKEIGTVNTKGNKVGTQSYNFVDASPAEGTNLYRIHHVSGNKTVDYTEVKALTFNNARGIQISPNPARDRIQVYIPGNSKNATLQLTDGLGKNIKTYKASGQSIQLNLPALSAGVYYLNVTKSDGTISRHKVVIE